MACGSDSTMSAERLTAGWESMSKEDRQAAARSLTGLGEAAVEPLARIARDRTRAGRADAIAALGLLGGPSAVRTLVSLLEDAESAVRNTAKDTLIRLGPQAVLPFLDKMNTHSYWLRQAMIEMTRRWSVRRAP